MTLDNNTQILAAYEQNGLTPEEIANNLGYTEEAVRKILIIESSTYRRDIKGVENQDITKEETSEMLEIIKYIARKHKTELPGAALKAAIYLHNEGKGRNNLKAMMGGGININIINQRIAGMKAAKRRVYGEEQGSGDKGSGSNIVDVEEIKEGNGTPETQP